MPAALLRSVARPSSCSFFRFSLAPGPFCSLARRFVRPDPAKALKSKDTNFMCQLLKGVFVPLDSCIHAHATYKCKATRTKITLENGVEKRTVEELDLTVAVSSSPPESLKRSVPNGPPSPVLWSLKNGSLDFASAEYVKHQLTNTFQLSFLSPAPPGIRELYAYTVMVPDKSESGSAFFFRLSQPPLGEGAVFSPVQPGAQPLLVCRCRTPQHDVRDEAFKFHLQKSAEKRCVSWKSIRARVLLDGSGVSDFAKIFVKSYAPRDQDIFTGQSNGEFMFLIMEWSSEFQQYASFFNKDETRRAAFAAALSATCTNIKQRAAACREFRNDRLHTVEAGLLEGLDQQDVENAQADVSSLLSSIVQVCKALDGEGVGGAADVAQLVSKGLQNVALIAVRNFVSNPETEAEKAASQLELQQLRIELEARQQALEQEQTMRTEAELRAQRAEDQAAQTQADAILIQEIQQRIIVKQSQESQHAGQALINRIQMDFWHNLCRRSIDMPLQLHKQWAEGSRTDLLRAIQDAVLGDSRSVAWLHGCHGCGKSAALAQLMLPSSCAASEPSPIVLSFFFVFGDTGSCAEVALASLCVQLWQVAFASSDVAALKYLNRLFARADTSSPHCSGVHMRELVQSKSLREISSIFLQMIQDLPQDSGARRIIIIMDAFDEISHHQCDLEAVTGPSQSAASLITRDFIRPLMMVPGHVNVSMVMSCISRPECRIAGVKFTIIDCQALRPTRSDLNGFISYGWRRWLAPPRGRGSC